MRSLRLFLVGLLSLITVRQCFAQPAVPAGGIGHPPLISVTGKSEIWVAPDQYEFSIVLVSERADAETAMKLNQEQLDRLRVLLAEFDIAGKDFRVADVRLEHPYRNGKRLPEYQVTRTCNFTLGQVSKKDSLLLSFTQSNIGEIQSVRASLRDPISLRERLRLQALQQARKKAQAMADSLQQSIGKAYWIEEITPEFWANPSANVMTRAPSEDGLSGAGQIHVQSTVKAAFLLQ